jgi:hypothetical protein
MAGRCPECGELVAASLGPDVRPGPPWEHRRTMGRAAAWWRCLIDAVWRPKRFGHQLRTTGRVADHRLFFGLHLPLVFLIGWAAMAGTVLAAIRWIPKTYSWHYPEVNEVVWEIGPVVGTLTMLGVLGLVLTVAGLVGLIYRAAQGRNLLNPALQTACYQVGYLLIWLLVSVALSSTLYWQAETGQLDVMEEAWGIDEDMIILLVLGIPNLVLLLGYFLRVYRGTAGARYANR